MSEYWQKFWTPTRYFNGYMLKVVAVFVFGLIPIVFGLVALFGLLLAVGVMVIL